MGTTLEITSGAKEDFATRSGLVNEKKLFSDEEYVEM